MNTQKLNIGLFGYGVVGKGFHVLIQSHTHLNIHAKIIVVKDVAKHPSIDGHFYSVKANDILQNEKITTVVEVINNSNDAYQIAKQVLRKGNTLITANKKMLAEHFYELTELEKQHGGCLLYEASSAGSIPIIRLLDQYFGNEKLRCVEGILNGTSNYILSGIFNQQLTYEHALEQAQKKGFAETDPSFDIGGFDSLHKLVILNALAFGVIVKPADVFNYGLTYINDEDINFAKLHGYTIKQVAHASVNEAGKLLLYVLPQFIKRENPLYHVDEEDNGIVVDAKYSGRQFYKGKGAGAAPTGAAVLADVIHSRGKTPYLYTKLKKPSTIQYDKQQRISVYMRFHKSINVGLLNIKMSQQLQSGDDKIIIGRISLNELLILKKLLEQDCVSVIVLENV